MYWQVVTRICGIRHILLLGQEGGQDVLTVRQRVEVHVQVPATPLVGEVVLGNYVHHTAIDKIF